MYALHIAFVVSFHLKMNRNKFIYDYCCYDKDDDDDEDDEIHNINYTQNCRY